MPGTRRGTLISLEAKPAGCLYLQSWLLAVPVSHRNTESSRKIMGFAWQKPHKGDKQNMFARGRFGVRAEQAGHTWRCPKAQGKVRMEQGGKGQAQSPGEQGVLSWLQQGKGLPAGSPLVFPPPPGSQGSGCAGRVTHIQISRHRTPQMFGPRWGVQGECFTSEPGVENKPLAHAAHTHPNLGTGSCSHSPPRSCRGHRGSLPTAPRPEQKIWSFRMTLEPDTQSQRDVEGLSTGSSAGCRQGAPRCSAPSCPRGRHLGTNGEQPRAPQGKREDIWLHHPPPTPKK